MAFTRNILLLSTIILLASFNRGKTVKLEEFKKTIGTYHLAFTMPVGFKSVPVRTGEKIDYDFAIRNRKNGMEIRYSVIPFSRFVEAYNKCSAGPACLLPAPEKQFKEMFYSKLGDISGGPDYEVEKLPEALQKEVARAEDGCSCYVTFSHSAGKPYNFAQIIHLEKKGFVDVIIQVFSARPCSIKDLPPEVLGAMVFADQAPKN